MIRRSNSQCNSQIDQKLFFSFLTQDMVNQVIAFFAHKPINFSKYCRKLSGLPFSFIRAGNLPYTEHEDHSIIGKANNSIFAISNHHLGSGTCGDVKVAQDIITKKIVVSKVQLLSSSNQDVDVLNEVVALNKLHELHATAVRTKDLKKTKGGWKRKRKKTTAAKLATTSGTSSTHILDVKFYIFSDFFYGMTLYKYFSYCNPTIEQTLIIIILVLEQLIKLHKLFSVPFIHGDLSLSNILINEFLDQDNNNKIEIKFIDYGWSGCLTNGIKMCVVAGEFSENNYFPPECYSKQVREKIIPECKKSPYLAQEIYIIDTALKWAEKYDYGFQSIASDIYNFMWGMFNWTHLKNSIVLEQCSIIGDNKLAIIAFNPFFRLNSIEIIDKCKEQLSKLSCSLPSSPSLLSQAEQGVAENTLLFRQSIKKIQSAGNISDSSNGLSRDDLDKLDPANLEIDPANLDKSNNLIISPKSLQKYDAFKLRPNG